jgi:ornithine decarboxylase
MAAIQILSAPKRRFSVDINISCSPDKLAWGALHGVLSASPPVSRFATPASSLACDDEDEEPLFPDLPSLNTGRPEIHLRNGVMNAARASAAHEADAERAFFVADLSQVYLQHLRWKKNLPEIEPYYGEIIITYPPTFLNPC